MAPDATANLTLSVSLWEANGLIDSEAVRLCLDNQETAVCFVDRDRRIAFWNRAAETLTGFLRQQVLGRACAEGGLLVHCDGHGTVVCQSDCPLDAPLGGRRCREQVLYLRHHDGYRFPVRVRSAPLFHPQGQPVGAVEVFAPAPRTVPAFPEKVAVLWFEFADWAQVQHFYGRDGAHQLVRSTALTLFHCVGAAGTVAHWTDQAFVVVLGGGAALNPAVEATRLLRLVEQARIPWWGDHDGAPIRAGAALCNAGEDPLAALMRARRHWLPESAVPLEVP